MVYETEQGKTAQGRTGEQTYDPGILQGHHVVDVQVRGGGPGGAVVGRGPRAGGGLARAVDGDGGGVSLKHVLARVARAGDGDPRREQVAVVVVAARRGAHGERRQLRLGSCRTGYARLQGTNSIISDYLPCI
jgi:hypothetical protein